MAAAKPKGPTVGARQDVDGTVHLGVTLERKFVPLITIPGFRVAQLAENAADSGDDDNDDDKEGGS